MLEVANSLNDISADRGSINYADYRTAGGIGDEVAASPISARRILFVNASGAPEGKLGEQLTGLGYDAVYLRAGNAALDDLDIRAANCTAILLDWRNDAPKDSHVAETLAGKARDLGLPVLTLAAAERPADARLAKGAGLATVLSTPCRLADLKSALDRMQGHALPRPASGFGLCATTSLLESCKFRFRTPDDINRLVPVIAALFPDPERSASGLSELMMNAIEHGNLEIGQERKAEWLARGIYRSELAKRLETPPYSGRWAEVIVNRREDGLMIVIMDEGCGFCWQDVIGDAGRETGAVVEPCGNGLAKAQQDSFDDLRFNHIGNQVTAFVATGAP